MFLTVVYTLLKVQLKIQTYINEFRTSIGERENFVDLIKKLGVIVNVVSGLDNMVAANMVHRIMIRRHSYNCRVLTTL